MGSGVGGIGVAGGTKPGVVGGKPGVGGGTPGVGRASNGATVEAGVGTMAANWADSRVSAPSTAILGTSDCNKGCCGVGGGINCWGVGGGGIGVGAINCCRSTWSCGRSPCCSANFLLTLSKIKQKKKKKLISGGKGVRIRSADNYSGGVATTHLGAGTGVQLTQTACRK